MSACKRCGAQPHFTNPIIIATRLCESCTRLLSSDQRERNGPRGPSASSPDGSEASGPRIQLSDGPDLVTVDLASPELRRALCRATMQTWQTFEVILRNHHAGHPSRFPGPVRPERSDVPTRLDTGVDKPGNRGQASIGAAEHPPKTDNATADAVGDKVGNHDWTHCRCWTDDASPDIAQEQCAGRPATKPCRLTNTRQTTGPRLVRPAVTKDGHISRSRVVCMSCDGDGLDPRNGEDCPDCEGLGETVPF